MNERGASTIGTAAGFLVFVLLLVAAVQVLFSLYATSMVTAAAHDVATEVAGFRSADDRCAATTQADADFAELLGAYGAAGHASLEWDCTDADVVSLRIIASHPSLVPPRLSGLRTLTELDRTIQVRVEAAR